MASASLSLHLISFAVSLHSVLVRTLRALKRARKMFRFDLVAGVEKVGMRRLQPYPGSQAFDVDRYLDSAP